MTYIHQHLGAGQAQGWSKYTLLLFCMKNVIKGGKPRKIRQNEEKSVFIWACTKTLLGGFIPRKKNIFIDKKTSFQYLSIPCNTVIACSISCSDIFNRFMLPKEQ